MFDDKFVYLNGKYLKESEAKISVFDRGFIFGDGVYEVAPVLNGVIVDKNEFLKRLFSSLSKLDIQISFVYEDIINALNVLIEKNNLKEGGVYLQITRGVAKRSFEFIKDLEPTIMAFTYEQDIKNSQKAKTGVKLISYHDLRWKRRDIKSLNLLGQCMARTYANDNKYDFALFVDKGYVNECDAAGFFMIKNDTLITKPLSDEILPSIRRANIIKIAKDMGLNVEQRAISLDEVYECDECFICAATILLLPVIKIDEKDIKLGKYTSILRQKYIEKLELEIKENS